MNFVDSVKILVTAGAGGDGKLSFRREKYISKGGPDGGDGGHGGNVVFIGSRNQDTLAKFRFTKELSAEPGQPGGPNNRHGKNGKPLEIAVPVGTLILNDEHEVLADIKADMQTAIIARGGQGGFGNAHFVSSRRQAPNFAEKGEPGDELSLQLELKMIADVGLVGMPNAGKSTLLSRVSNARPEIANYPFTTLKPNLGMVPIGDDTNLLFADIPGLIEGASDGKGLGHDFLKHVERTKVLVHIIDAYNEDVATTYKTIRGELQAYSQALSERPEVIALSKVEGLDEDIIQDHIASLQSVAGTTATIYPISAQSGIGVQDLLFAVNRVLAAHVSEQESQQAADEAAVPTYTLTDKDDRAWTVRKEGDIFVIRGNKIEKFARRTNFENTESMKRLRDIMRKMGIMHALKRQGLGDGDTIRIGHVDRFTF